MSYTNVDIVRSHFGATSPARDRILDQSLSIKANENSNFYNSAVDESSVVVKANLNARPIRQTVTFVGGKAQIGVAQVARGSLVIASDSSLGDVYVENVDYTADYTAGRLTAIEGGRIGPSSSLVVWFDALTVYVPGTDYAIDSARAAIRRLAGGSIIDGQELLIDFTPLDRQLSTDLISAVVTEANAAIERDIDPNSEFGADPTLQAAATYRALEALCRVAAMQELRNHFADDRIATTWLKLSDQLAQKSGELIRSFRKPFTGPVTAAKS